MEFTNLSLHAGLCTGSYTIVQLLFKSWCCFFLQFVAAHCVHGPITDQYRYVLDSVRLGENDLRTDTDCQDVRETRNSVQSYFPNFQFVCCSLSLFSIWLHDGWQSFKGRMCWSRGKYSSCRTHRPWELQPFGQVTSQWHCTDSIAASSTTYQLYTTGLFTNYGLTKQKLWRCGVDGGWIRTNRKW